MNNLTPMKKCSWGFKVTLGRCQGTIATFLCSKWQHSDLVGRMLDLGTKGWYFFRFTRFGATVVCPWTRHFICLVLVQPSKTEDMAKLLTRM